MKDEELKTVWGNLGSDKDQVTRGELSDILNRKVKGIKRRFYTVLGISSAVSVVVITLLVKASVDRSSDVLYVWNNVLLGLITLISLVSALYSWYRLGQSRYATSIKESVERDIEMIRTSLYGKFRYAHWIVIPLIYVLLLLSINVYFDGRTFIEVMRSGEAVTALISGLIVGLPVSYFVESRIRKYHKSNLKRLEVLYEKIKG